MQSTCSCWNPSPASSDSPVSTARQDLEHEHPCPLHPETTEEPRMANDVHTTHQLHAADLGRAMIEQARLGDAYERAVGTSAEQSAFMRLQRAGREVSRCDQDVRDDRNQRVSRPS